LNKPLFNPTLDSLTEIHRRKLFNWFDSDERSALERVVRGRMALLSAEFSEAAIMTSMQYLQTAELTKEQKQKLTEISRLSVFIEVLQEMEATREKMVIVPQIAVN
jgi:hypothetical protein